MRVLPVLFALLPTILFAEDISLTSDVSAVTLYPQGATITRQAPFSAPAGQHDLILTDLPQSTPLESVRVDLTGATLGNVTARDDFVPPRDDVTDAAIAAAEAEVERLEQQLRDGRAGVEAIRLQEQAAEARVAFLNKIGEGEGLAQMDVAALRELAGMIGEEILTAKTLAHEAGLRADAAQRGLKDTREALDKARAALRALVPEDEARAMLAIAVSSETATQGVITITYNIPYGQWMPVYDLRLDRKAGKLVMERGAFIFQETGENWEDVQLTLSTVRPSEQTAPSKIWPWRRWIEDPAELRRKQLSGAVDFQSGLAATAEMMAEPAMEAPVIVDEAVVSFDGLAATYVYPEPVSVASGADRVRIALGELETEADVTARAVPLADSTAYIMAEITNQTGELILPGLSSFYLDGRYIGQRNTDLIPAGGEAELPFGPIDGLRLTRIVRDRNAGDRGVITRSNELTENVRIEVENLTGETWPVRLLDRVPFSEQEDLEVSWTARPRPAETAVDGQRGILMWRFDLAPGEKTAISLTHALEWPEGMVLR